MHVSRLVSLAVLAALVLVACQPDPTEGQRPPPAGAAVPAFDGRTRAATIDDVRLSWREGCPVHWRDLRVVTVSYWGFDGGRKRGPIVVHSGAAADIFAVFEHLYHQRIQIRRIHRVDDYGADDNRSMAANNTSAFNCRRIAGSTAWSRHAYGRAIDINPMQNFYKKVNGPYVPPGSDRWKDRRQVTPGMIVDGDLTVDGFDWVGWTWGGRWTDPVDHQHFQQ